MAPAGPVPPGTNRLTRTGIFLARAAAVAGLLALAAAPAFAQTDVWTATLTPADFSGTLGCNNASATATRKCSTATVLSDDDFTYDSTDYSVTTLFLTATAFTFTVDADITAATNALTVVVGSTSLAFADAMTQTARTRTWFNPGFSWTAGTAVSIRITGPTPIVHPDWSLKPTGLAEGSQFRLLFLSSTKRDATATDIADYNTFVQDRAEAGHTDIQGYSAGFRAVGCTADTDARDNTATTYTISDKGVPIYWLDGAKVADDYADFYDESWHDEANDKNESGANGPDTSQQANYPFTGCEDNGTEATFNVNSVALGGPGGLGVRVGRPNSSTTGDGPISGSLNETKTNTRPMYGLSAVFEVLVVPPSLTSAVVPADGNTIQLAFSEDLQSANLPPAAAFTVTAGGTAVTVTGVAAGTTEDVLEITVSPLIGQGQAVVVAYEDPTNGDDANAIQDTVGNDTPDFTTGAGDVPAVNNNSALTNEVLASWGLTPTGLAVGDKFRLLFLSSTKRDALSSDIADYNTFVQDRAAAGHADIQAYSGGFGAIGCTAAVDARDNTSTTGTGVPIYWLDGTKVADDYADFYDGSWDDEINDKNKSGTDAHDTSQSDNYPFTGCKDDGTESFAGATRPRSLGAPLGFVRIGRPNSSEGPIDGNDVARTGDTRPMYGLSAVFEVSSSPSTNPSVPAAISDVAVVPEPRTTDSLRVSWTAPDNTGKPALTGYDLRYKGTASDAEWVLVSHAGTGTSGTLTGLDEDTDYFVEVRALNAEYSGPWSVTAEGATTPVPEVVLANHPLVPADLGPGDSFRLLHVTNDTTAATSTGIHGYDSLVTFDVLHIVGRGNLLGLWPEAARLWQRALVSTPGADARLLTDTTWNGTDRGVPIYWVNGARVAADYQDFYDGAWADEANPMTGFGEPRSLTSTAPWTGAGDDGTELFEGTVSQAMGQASVGVGAPGSTASGAGPLNGGAAFASTEERPLYGLWHVMVIDENFRLAGNLNSGVRASEDSDERAAVRAQLFTTGSHPGGYGISEIAVQRGSGDEDGFLGDVALYTTDASGDPDLADGLHATLSLESIDQIDWTLAAPEGTVLEASTTYALVFEGKAGAYPKFATNSADGEDAVAEGWSIADVLRYHDGSNWVDNPNGYALTMDIKGPLAAVTTEVPSGWSLIPTGLKTGDRFRLLFLSSTKRDGTATDIATYNTFIQNLAAAGHTDIRDYSAGFRVVGCTADTDARDNTATTYTNTAKGVPIYWLNGAKAADEYEDFYDGSWDDEANDKNESGTDAHETSIQSNFPSTGCNHDGTEAFQAGDSIALGGSDVRLGRPNSTGSGHGPISSDRHRRTDVTFTNPLYGLSGLFQVAAAANSPAMGAPTITGTPQVGQTLTAVTTAIMDTDGLTTPGYTYQWIRVATDTTETNIGSATASTYTLVTDDLGTTIKVKVSFTDDASNAETLTSVATAAVSAPTAPGAPTGLTATASGNTRIDLSWTAPASDGGSAITGYKIEISSDGGNAWTTHLADTTNPNTTYAHTGLAASTTRHYRVSAINTIGTGAASNVDDATTGTTAPGAPTGLVATASGTTQIDLSWTAPASDGGSAITGYKIEESPDGNSSWTTLEADTNGPATTYSHTGLSAGTTRHYRVSAINTIGTSAASNVDDATTGTTAPDAPTGLAATASGNTRIDLSWTAPASDGGSAITGYKIEISSDGGTSWSDHVANTSGTGTTYAHTGLAAGTTRHYRVSAINTNGAGAPSNVDDATTGTTVPDAPTSLTATASGNTRIDLTWTAPAITGGSPITGYKIEESPNGNSNWTTLEADTNGPATTGTTVPDAPTGLAATASGNTRINLTWTAPAITGGSPITGYKIEESPNGNSNWTTLEANTNATTYAHTGLAGGTTRHYRVSAINSNGAGAPSNVDSATTGTSVPGAPTDLSARASGTTQVDLSWTAPASDGGSPVTGYRIEESPNGRSSWTVLVATTGNPATTYSRAGLASGATRHYRVSAVNTNGAGAPSNTASTTTGTTVPGAPTRLTAAASGTARINLSWTAPASDGGIRITGYRIESSLGSGSSWTDVVANSGTTGTTYSDTGLSGGTTRHYRVSAINTNGAGAPSNVDGATTGTTVPDAPTDLTARVSENTRINLSWARPASDGGSLVTGYRIEISSDGGSSWTDRVANTRSPHRAYSHIVAAGATRHYRVSAISAKGTSAHSNVASATTVLRRVRFEADLYTAREGGAAATVAVVLSAAAPAAVTIPLTREHLSGATEADYSGVPAGVTFAAGQARQTFTVTVTEDSDEDGLKRLRLQFGTLPSGYASDPPRTAVVRLVDNDGDLLVDFGTERHTTVQVREHADVRHRFSVYLRTNRYGPPNNNRQQSLTIPLVVQHVGGAEEDVDYTPRIPASVTFAAGQSQASFSIRAIPDGERESGEGLRIDFGPLPSGVARGAWGPYETIAFLDAGAPASANLSVAGPLLTLGYPGALDRGSTPSPRDFVVSAEAPGGEKAMAPVAAVSVRGSDVFLQLARPVLPDETVTLSYLADAMHPIREAAGLPAPPLNDAPVRNDTPASGPGPEAGLPVQAGIPAAMAVLPEEAPVGAQTQRLDLSSRNLTDLSALAGLTGLRELDLSGNRIADLSPLAGLTALEQLSLAGNRIADLRPLAGLTGLERLHLSANRIGDLSPLAGLSGLRVLHLSTNRIGDLSPLAGLSGLQVLDLAGNQIEELWPLAGLTALERLNLSDNRIEELWPLAGLSGLEVLLLDRNRVADLSALSPLAELANLGLSGNRIADLWPLAGLDRLRRLDLSGNAVANLSALGDVSGLVWLRLPGNPVSDVAPLGRLEQLLWLWLDSGTAAGMEALAPPAGHGAAQLWIELTPAQ